MRVQRTRCGGASGAAARVGGGLAGATVAAGIVALVACASQRDGTRKLRGPSAASGDAANESVYFIDGMAGRLRISDGGSEGTPVLFVHGLGCRIDCWRAQLDHLRPFRRAIAYDQRGHGDSDRSRDGVYTIEALADDLEAVVDALGLDQFFLVGHSMAGQVLTAYAARHPEKVAGLLYTDAQGDFQQATPEQREAFVAQAEAKDVDVKALFEQTIGPSARPETRERVLAAVELMDAKAVPALRRSMAGFVAVPLLAKYPGPRLAVDDASGQYPQFLLVGLLPQLPRKTLANVSHWLMMDDTAGFDVALDGFIGFVRAEHSDEPIEGAGSQTIGR
jgi:pimeloyl-ACP methyl ester carboxylesterase